MKYDRQMLMLWIKILYSEYRDGIFSRNNSTDLPDSTLSHSKQQSSQWHFGKVCGITHAIRTVTFQSKIAQIFYTRCSSSVHITGHVYSMVQSWQDAYEHRQRLLTLATSRLWTDVSIPIMGIRLKCNIPACVRRMCTYNTIRNTHALSSYAPFTF